MVEFEKQRAQRQQVARAQAALVEKLRGEPDVRAVTFATALPRMDHPIRLMDVDQNAAAVAVPAAGPFKVRTTRIAIDFFDEWTTARRRAPLDAAI